MGGDVSKTAGGPVVAIESVKPKASTCGPIREFWQASDGSCDLAHLVVLPNHETDRHWHERLTEVYVCVRGIGLVEIDGVEMTLRQREAVTILPRARHQLRNASDAELELYILAHPKFDPEDVYPA
jgi:mannose-6-phosphate isomerase-like protein (cupin superfamily)